MRVTSLTSSRFSREECDWQREETGNAWLGPDRKRARMFPSAPRESELALRLLGRTSGDGGGFALLHQRGTLANAVAEVGELGPSDIAMALDFDFVHAR